MKRLDLYLHPPTFELLSCLIKYFDTSPTPPQILFLGDSVLERVADQDSDRRNLAEMVTQELSPYIQVVPISRTSYHPRLFYRILQAVVKMRYRPCAVILPINIRAFSPQWDLRPDWQYDEEIAALKKYAAHPERGAGVIRRSAKKDETDASRKTTVKYPLSPYNKIGEFLDLIRSNPTDAEEIRFRKKQIFVFHYAFPLERNHRNLLALEDTIRLLRQSNIKVLIYLVPINIQAGARLVGPEFVKQVKANTSLLSGVLSPYVGDGRIRYADWSTEFSEAHFFHDSFATEHLNQAGRLALTQLIVNDVSQFMDFDQKAVLSE